MTNRILKALPPQESRSIAPHLKLVELNQDAVLHETGEVISEVYFPENATISYFSNTAEGETLEVSVIGNEGVVGVASIFAQSASFRSVVQLPGRAYCIRRDVLRREFRHSEILRHLLLNYMNALLVQVAQNAVCNKFHSVEERFCKWLLMARERSISDRLPLTQEALARVLGSRRASVSVAASFFQQKGAIRYSRGVIHILDRKHLEAATCECYGIINGVHSTIAD
jgi:CRP-like cAMP-binding protein